MLLQEHTRIRPSVNDSPMPCRERCDMMLAWGQEGARAPKPMSCKAERTRNSMEEVSHG
jgi:hypothetical protein